MQAMETTLPPGLVHVGRLDLEYAPPLVYDTHAGRRGFLRAASGTLAGERIAASVADDGGDWLVFRPDGIIETDTRLMLAAEDGSHVYLRSRGLIRATPEACAAFGNGPADGAAEFSRRCAPWFEAPPGRHEWLAKAVFLAVGTFSWSVASIDLFEVS